MEDSRNRIFRHIVYRRLRHLGFGDSVFRLLWARRTGSVYTLVLSDAGDESGGSSRKPQRRFIPSRCAGVLDNYPRIRRYRTASQILYYRNSRQRKEDLSLAILNEEVEHESWFSEFLGEGPSGHFMRRGETSPFVSKFLK